MNIDPNLVVPSQNFLKPNTVRFILDCFAKNELDKLPPTPIVRRDPEGKYVAIDGHNLLAVCTYLNKHTVIHLATSAEDGLAETSAESIDRNNELRNKFDDVLVDKQTVQSEGIATFRTLIAQYPELFPPVA